jgi:hypothetical protein
MITKQDLKLLAQETADQIVVEAEYREMRFRRDDRGELKRRLAKEIEYLLEHWEADL